MKPLIVIGSSTDPYHNLAIEETLLYSCKDRRILYLWQNDRTVVIGRHQDASYECDLEKMEEDGIRLSRRLSGGGAVYHDMGNLNFTFIAPNSELSIDENFGIIADAVKKFGIETCRTGNNDLGIAQTGAKFSGSAFFRPSFDNDTPCYHHGTILCSCDIEKMAGYLTPSSGKLSKHGVKSVSARVANIGIEVGKVRDSVIESFTARYGEAESAREDVCDAAAVAEAERRLSSHEWLFSI